MKLWLYVDETYYDYIVLRMSNEKPPSDKCILMSFDIEDHKKFFIKLERWHIYTEIKNNKKIWTASYIVFL